jgi:microcystin-dependent protein
MGNPYLGEIRMFAGNYAPLGWMLCDGQTLPINVYQALFSVIGTTYGGDGTQTFNLPDLRGRLPLHRGTKAGVSFALGAMGGVESVPLTIEQTPPHRHPLMATTSGFQLSPAGAAPSPPYSTQVGVMVYGNIVNNPTSLHPDTIQPAGGNEPHTNIQPSLCVNFIIAMNGVFPSQT